MPKQKKLNNFQIKKLKTNLEQKIPKDKKNDISCDVQSTMITFNINSIEMKLMMNLSDMINDNQELTDDYNKCVGFIIDLINKKNAIRKFIEHADQYSEHLPYYEFIYWEPIN